MVDTFSLKFQRDNRQNALAVWIPPRGKPEKKAVFSPYCGDETTTNYNRAKRKAFPVLGKAFLPSGKADMRDSIRSKVLGREGVWGRGTFLQ